MRLAVGEASRPLPMPSVPIRDFVRGARRSNRGWQVG